MMDSRKLLYLFTVWNWMGANEVTVGQYKAFVAVSGYKPRSVRKLTELSSLYAKNPPKHRKSYPDFDNFPDFG